MSEDLYESSHRGLHSWFSTPHKYRIFQIFLVCPFEQSCIAIGKKSVAVLNGMSIRNPHPVYTGKRTDKHKQGRSREMKIGQKLIHNTKAFVLWINF